MSDPLTPRTQDADTIEVRYDRKVVVRNLCLTLLGIASGPFMVIAARFLKDPVGCAVDVVAVIGMLLALAFVPRNLWILIRKPPLLRIGEAGIEYTPGWGRLTRLAWEDIGDVKCVRVLGRTSLWIVPDDMGSLFVSHPTLESRVIETDTTWGSVIPIPVSGLDMSASDLSSLVDSRRRRHTRPSFRSARAARTSSISPLTEMPQITPAFAHKLARELVMELVSPCRSKGPRRHLIDRILAERSDICGVSDDVEADLTRGATVDERAQHIPWVSVLVRKPSARRRNLFRFIRNPARAWLRTTACAGAMVAGLLLMIAQTITGSFYAICVDAMMLCTLIGLLRDMHLYAHSGKRALVAIRRIEEALLAEPELRGDASRMQSAQTLLRPSTAPDETLVRPARGASGDATVLIRPAHEPPETLPGGIIEEEKHNGHSR